MPYSDVVWAYKDPLTTQKLNQMDDNSVFCAEHRIFGCPIDITGTSTVRVGPGRMEIGGIWLTRDDWLTAITADNNACWEEGANAEGSSTGWYIVAWNDSAASFQTKFRASGPAYSDTLSGTANGPKIYDKTGTTWYRYIGYLYNNEVNVLQKLRYNHNGWFYYIGSAIVTSAPISSAWATVSVKGLISPMILESQVDFFVPWRSARYQGFRQMTQTSGFFLVGGVSGEPAHNLLSLPFINGQIQVFGSGANATATEFQAIAYRLAGR